MDRVPATTIGGKSTDADVIILATTDSDGMVRFYCGVGVYLFNQGWKNKTKTAG